MFYDFSYVLWFVKFLSFLLHIFLPARCLETCRRNFWKFIAKPIQQVVLHHEHCKFWSRINKLIAVFWSLYHNVVIFWLLFSAAMLLWFSVVMCFVTSFFPSRATLMSILQEFHLAYSSPSCNSRWPSPLRLLVLTLSPTDGRGHQKSSALHSCNDRHQRLQFVQAIVVCYVINFSRFKLMLPVIWKQDHILIFKSKLAKNIKSVEAGVEVYSFPFRKKKIPEQNWLIFQKTD